MLTSEIKSFSTSPQGFKELSRLFLNNSVATGDRLISLKVNSIDRNLASVLHAIDYLYKDQKTNFPNLTIEFAGSFPRDFGNYFMINFYEWPLVLLFKLCPTPPDVKSFFPWGWESFLKSYEKEFRGSTFGRKISKHRAENLFFCLSEILKNAGEHSNSETKVFVCSDYTAETDLLKITVTDCGDGIAKSLERSTGDIVDAGTAIQRIFSKTQNSIPRSPNAESSLVRIASICSNTGGNLLLVSGIGYGLFEENQFTSGSLELPFRGTIVNLSIKLR